MRLPAFFCYYGAKWRAAPHYPRPSHDVVIEPFCGAAGFSVLNHRRQVRLFDVNETIIGVWRYLIAVRQAELLALPDVVDEIPAGLAPEARDLIGFWLNKGCERPRPRAGAWMRSGKYPGSFWGPAVRQRLAGALPFIRHWTAAVASYESLPDVEATWFIDPPYEGAAGRHYKFSSIDYAHLGEWCRRRRGQVIVCEEDGARWLPFTPLRDVKGLREPTREAVWLNTESTLSQEKSAAA